MIPCPRLISLCLWLTRGEINPTPIARRLNQPANKNIKIILDHSSQRAIIRHQLGNRQMQVTEISKRDHEVRRLNSRSKTRVFVHPEGESIMENLQNRRARPAKLFKPFVEKAAAALGVAFESVGWSQNAGCSCGCSPGFVVKGSHRPGFDIHVTLKVKG